MDRLRVCGEQIDPKFAFTAAQYCSNGGNSMVALENIADRIGKILQSTAY